jgi:CRP-like cAMP-binding protein
VRYQELYQRVCTLSPLPEAEWAKVEGLALEQAVARKGFFLRPGDASERFGLVIEGVFRVYRVSADGEESVKAFRAEGQFIGPYVEMLQGLASTTHIQALEPSRVLAFRISDIHRLEGGHPCWTMLFRRMAELHFVLKERREMEFLELTAEERLQRFWEEHAHLANRLPQREVAGYLGITPVALSRIQARRRSRRKGA